MRRIRLVAAILTCIAMLVPAIATAQSAPPSAYTMGASLSGAAEVPGPGHPNGFGFARVSVNFAAGELCYRISVANVEGVTMAHIHSGAAGVAGPIVITLTAPVSGLSSGCVPISGEQGANILNNASSFYVNVHSSAYPAGAVRGQLAPLGYLAGAVVPGGPYVSVVAAGLNGPRGIDWDSNGKLFFTDNGVPAKAGSAGCVVRLNPETGEDEEQCATQTGRLWTVGADGPSVVSNKLPGHLNGLVIAANDTAYIVGGLGGNPVDLDPLYGDFMNGYGDFSRVNADGSYSPVAHIADYEVAHNPAGQDVDSNPYAALAVGSGFLVVDAGGNDILHVDADGDTTTFAVLPPLMTAAPPFLGLPEGTQIPAQSVPTSIVQGPDGAFYVSELTGFPFPVGGSRIWRLQDVNGDGDALDAGEMTVYATGLTNVVDLAFTASGNLYALEIAKDSLLVGMDGALVRVSPDGNHTVVLSDGLVAPTGLAVAPDGLTLYVANFGVMPGAGQILKVTTVE